MNLYKLVRDVPDFPKAGIIFKDITPLLKNHEAFSYCVNEIARFAKKKKTQGIAAIDARGFIIGSPVALKLKLPFIPIRKKGKLPWHKKAEEFALEYGTDSVEVHVDAVAKKQNILVVDDVLATGGTAHAACKLVEMLGGRVSGCAFLVELSFLNGKSKINGYDVFSMIQY